MLYSVSTGTKGWSIREKRVQHEGHIMIYIVARATLRATFPIDLSESFPSMCWQCEDLKSNSDVGTLCPRPCGRPILSNAYSILYYIVGMSLVGY